VVFGESDPIGEDEGTLKSGLIRGVVFGESDPIGEDEGTLKSGLIRGVVFGESDPIHGHIEIWSDKLKRGGLW
jgi:hypothetical protein